MTRHQLFVIIVHVVFSSFGAADFSIFDMFHNQDDDGQKQNHSNRRHSESFPFAHENHKGQEMEDFNFGTDSHHHRGQESVDFPFWAGHEDMKGQEVEEIHFGPKHEDHKGQEVEEINFGPKVHHKGQEPEEFHFGSKRKDPKGQQIEEINFGPKEDHRGQEVEDIHFGPKEEHEGQKPEGLHFGPKHEDYKGQEVEEINFGPKEHHKGQQPEEFHYKPKDPKGQQVEEINFGPKEDHRGQEIEDIHFGPKHKEPLKGQQIEEINFGPKHEDYKGQEIEEIHFGAKQDQKGQKAEEFHFGPKHETPKGQQIEEINFGPKEDHKGQEVEDIHFGPKHEDHKGQEVEEINFGPKEHHKGQQPEEFHFGPKHKDPKGQLIEEINFGPKEDHKGQEVEDIHFGPKHEDHKGLEVEEINFGPKEDHKGQEVEDIHFGPKHEDHKGQEVEEINFGPKEDHKGQEPEEFQFGPKHEDTKGQQIEEINFGPKPKPGKDKPVEVEFIPLFEHPEGQEEINFGHEPEHDKEKKPKEYYFDGNHENDIGQETEEIKFGAKPGAPGPQEEDRPTEVEFVPLPKDPVRQENEDHSSAVEDAKQDGDNPKNQGHWFDIFLPAAGAEDCTERPKVPANSVLKCESNRKCELVCQEGYGFPSSTAKVVLECDGGKWSSAEDDDVPECNPICEPPCQNDGVCIAPNQCSCKEGFEGAECQSWHKPCSNHPAVPHYSHYNCNSRNCTVDCFDGYTFPDGTSSAHLTCHDGEWTLLEKDWKTLPECRPSCHPPCDNGGVCLAYNKCQCPREYAGPQCQYELSACDAKKLNFNGIYTCRGDSDTLSCTLSCPEGHDANGTFAQEYICHYSAGKFLPEPIPQCVYGDNTEVIKSSSTTHTIYEGVLASSSTCSSWKGTHYKTFDGKVYSFDNNCSYILVQDLENNFRITVEYQNCESTICSRSVKVSNGDQEYEIRYGDKIPLVTINGNLVSVPTGFQTQLEGCTLGVVPEGIVIAFQTPDLTLNWNAEDHLSITVNGNLRSRLGGLCGYFDNDPNDEFYTQEGFFVADLESFVQSWLQQPYSCTSRPVMKNDCGDESAANYCRKIFTDVHFERCLESGRFQLYQKACMWDVCKCGPSCACDTISEFVKSCQRYLASEGLPDSTSDWRQIAECPLTCPPGKVYSYCGPSFQTSCGSLGADGALAKYSDCVEGCFCPEGLVQLNDSCVRREFCPCKWRNKHYSKGERIMKDCNTCTCQDGEWVCTTLRCSSRCSAVGTSHYVTFDGRRYDLTGQCAYYLLKSEEYAIASRNQPCEGDVLDEIFHGHRRSFCTKQVTITHGKDEIRLRMNKEVSVNGMDLSALPVSVIGVTIRLASLHVIVNLPDGVEVWWDGNTNVYVDLPGGYAKATGGLCGSFNENQRDDFKTPEGDVEATAVSFAEKWKTEETCTEMIDQAPTHPCGSDADYKAAAESRCQKLLGDVFKECHSYVDVEPYYKNCLHDVCSCRKGVKNCICPIFADYAMVCSQHYMELPWRSEVRECGLHCPQGQIYQPCGDSCARSCQDISITKGQCDKKCSEGCSCPEGLVLNSVGQCIPVSKCPCFHQNVKYKPGQEIIMEGDGAPRLCACQNALWSCRPATRLEIAREYENSENKCNETLHEEYTACQPAEPKTCKNMHERPKHSTRICFPGCVCKKGFVWDSIGKVCVNASECPCHHGGRSYVEGERFQQDCNTCTCKSGRWSCTERDCSSVCSTWGDSHFKTFDGRVYDFQGSCDFVFASGIISEYETFFISLQIVPCGSTGISCPKSVTLKVGSPDKEEKVVFKVSDHSIIPRDLKRILVREVGVFVFAEVFDLGISVQWDRGTRVYVKADSRWKHNTKGLCGNFNDNDLDDFKTPSSGETSEISPVVFADSWRLQSYCPESSQIANTCERRPHRKAWSVRKCSILNSESFEACHSEVAVEPYLERCVLDACGCDEGGDCECMCTAVAAYAQECTLRGVPVKWRTQEFCRRFKPNLDYQPALQCPEHSTYDSCVSTCPPKSCDNQFQHSALLQTCSQHSCVEGCERPPCPPGHVLPDSSSTRCIPIASCKTVCLTINNVTYLEGDLMKSDDCHSCYCSHHAEVCSGEPCHEVTSTTTSPSTVSVCPENQVWDDCIVKCNQVCNSLRHNLNTECSRGDDCISGCRAVDLKCSPGMFLRDQHTCVHEKDCPCRSTSGVLLKPGETVRESECEKCQCVNNEYECVNECVEHPTTLTTSAYNGTHKRHNVTLGFELAQEGNVTLIYHTTPTPTRLCPEEQYKSLIDTFSRFSASSHLDETSSPVFGSMSSEGTWIAGASNADQYLQVDLGKIETIFAVKAAGGSINHVMEYHLLYSVKGDVFSDVLSPDGQKEVFKAPSGSQDSAEQVLRAPIQARFIRFHPITWHEQIAMKVDVLGCAATTPAPTRTCDKPIGIGRRHFPKLRISASSSKPGNKPEFVAFATENGWRPLTNSESEWVQVDFGELVNLTGVVTRGCAQGNEVTRQLEESWVERYKVGYSQDGETWRTVLDEFGNEMIFLGNTDGESEKNNFFAHPIQAKSLKILPLKWHQNVALRLDVLGCYDPEDIDVEVVPPVTTPTLECNVCPGTLIGKDHCKCAEDEWWTGENCVHRSECPCFVGLIAYPVGTTFTTEKCEECVCKLHGIPHCTPKQCKDCPTGLQKVVTPLCGCICKPCEANARLCPSSNTCLNESQWCDGIQDCPDDEVNCTTPTPTKAPPASCLPSCPPGYDVVFRNKKPGPTEAEDMLRHERVKSIKSTKSVKTYRKTKKNRKSQRLAECPPYDCVPVKVETEECPPPECPLGYLVNSKKGSESESSCPLYTCEPTPEYANCTVSSKNVKTFDGTDYKYEICDHVMARHDSGLWNVTMIKDCANVTSCAAILRINHGDHTLELNSRERTVKFDLFPYSVDQMEILNSKMADFSLNPIGNSIVFTSDLYGFEVVFDANGNLKLRVPSSMKSHLNGLCGLYNGRPTDDKTQPDGKLAKTAVDFGDSWSNPGGRTCVETVCPMEMQATALEICSKLKEKPFNSCGEMVNLEHCIESTCECLASHREEDKCRCELLSDFASNCRSPDLLGWRVDHDCPSSCPPHLVHYDCYPYACQPTCGNEECTEPAAQCYSGCFCPDGLVKRGDQCIKVTECRDCVCSGLGDSTYLTFDGGMTFNGNCTYVATRERVPGGPDFEVLISNSLCNGSDFMTCTDKIEVKVPGHSIKIIAVPDTEQMVELLVDGRPTDPLEAKSACKGWSEVTFSPETSSVKVELPKEHVDVRYFYKRFAFTISLPSHYYSDRVEGLCGTCSQNGKDAEELESPEVWQSEEGGSCLIEPPPPCVPTPEHEKICLLMSDPTLFGQCLAFVDPTPFIDQCLTVVCANGHVCNSLEAYGQACRDAGVCVEWRSDSFCPFTCPSDLEYQACHGCQLTCDMEKKCEGSLMEGCVCPGEQVLINGTCKSSVYCEYCDKVGRHYEDEVWQVDKCTNCTCKNQVITCDKMECPAVDVVCRKDEIVVKEEDQFECCPRYKCGCKPREQCERVELPKELLPGMEAVVNETGCCPKIEIVCRQESCPPPKDCGPHYVLEVINTTSCCPEYSCERPDNLCVYEFGSESSEHKTKGHKRGLQLEVVKEIGERWSDGPCKTCVCVEKNGVAEAVCTLTECPNLEEHPDHGQYELEEVHHPERCCPEVRRKACKHEGHVYQVGDTWVPDEGNPCETLKCNNWRNGSVVKETRLEVCNYDCELGWEYRRRQGSCCGHCVQTGCTLGDKVFREGESWFSEDNCSKSVCVSTNGHFSISTQTTQCPSIEHCPREDVYRDGCCFKCKIPVEDRRVCIAEVVPPESTVGVLRHNMGRHGECFNREPIGNFTRCSGNCQSFTEFNPKTLSHDSVCTCCRALDYSLITVDLLCEDGLLMTKSITVPATCACVSCGG